MTVQIFFLGTDSSIESGSVEARIWNYSVGIQSSQFEYSRPRQDIDVRTHGGTYRRVAGFALQFSNRWYKMNIEIMYSSNG